MNALKSIWHHLCALWHSEGCIADFLEEQQALRERLWELQAAHEIGAGKAQALIEALEWYATESNWRRLPGRKLEFTSKSWARSPAQIDRGARAKSVLTQVSK